MENNIPETGSGKEKKMAQEEKKCEKNKKAPRVAPGFNDEKFGEDATRNEIRNQESTRVTRVFLDENDPS